MSALAPSLPIGVRDFLPLDTARRREIVTALTDRFDRWGYSRVLTPSFEYEEVFERGGADPRQLIRFVEPTSARVAALRLDFTPQVARLVATRMQDQPMPLRLFYEGTVLRLSRAAGPQRELVQAGVELVGKSSPAGDVEVITACSEALRAAGVGELHLDIGHFGLVRSVLEKLPEPEREEARRVLARKSRYEAGALNVPRAQSRMVERLANTFGGPEVLSKARRMGTSGRRAATEVSRVLDRLPDGVAEGITVDFGEVRGFDYYSGVRFAFLAPGLGDPIAVGGRYDDLLGRFGFSAPATGFAVDVDLLTRATVKSTVNEPGRQGAVCTGPMATRVAGLLRTAGRRAITYEGKDSAAYARAWGFEQLIHATRTGGIKVRYLAGEEDRFFADELREMLGKW